MSKRQNAKSSGQKTQNNGRARGRPESRIPTEGGRSVAHTLLQTIPIFPIAKEVKGMVYYDYLKTLAGGVGAIPTNFFTGNGLFDPDNTGIGHQPMGFDQMMGFYEQATVIRSHIRVTFYSAGAATRVGLYLNPDTTSPSLPRIVENGLMKMGLVGGSGTGNGAHAFATLELACDVPSYFGRRRGEILADPQMYTTIAANPGEMVHFGVCAWSAFDSAAEVAVGYDVTITYDAVFWEPKKLTSS
jgi:hypothetical protein